MTLEEMIAYLKEHPKSVTFCKEAQRQSPYPKGVCLVPGIRYESDYALMPIMDPNSMTIYKTGTRARQPTRSFSIKLWGKKVDHYSAGMTIPDFTFERLEREISQEIKNG